jgi:hypothetical protein
VPNVDPLGAAVGVGTVAPMTSGRRRRAQWIGLAWVRCLGSQLEVRRFATGSRCLGNLTLAARHGVGLLRACAKEQLPQPADRRVLVLDQVAHVGVRVGDRPQQPVILCAERLLSAAQNIFQLRTVHFDHLRRVSHPATTGT